VRAVLDPNVLIASLLSRSGAPAQIVSRWLAGEFELVVSQALLAELARALAYPKIRERIPGDDYLLALAETERAVLVSGDQHLLALADELPILTPRAFLDALAQA
jgi:predicted nucleic acid-binding protein